MNTIGLQTIVYILEVQMLDTQKAFQFNHEIGCTNENYWQLAYKLKLEVWFYFLYEVKDDLESDTKMLLVPKPSQLDHLICCEKMKAISIYLLSPSYVNKTDNWKLHKINKISKATSKLNGSPIYQCVLENDFAYIDGICDDENEDILKFETIFSI
jgi:hypothetical protein